MRTAKATGADRLRAASVTGTPLFCRCRTIGAADDNAVTTAELASWPAEHHEVRVRLRRPVLVPRHDLEPAARHVRDQLRHRDAVAAALGHALEVAPPL